MVMSAGRRGKDQPGGPPRPGIHHQHLQDGSKPIESEPEIMQIEEDPEFRLFQEMVRDHHLGLHPLDPKEQEFSDQLLARILKVYDEEFPPDKPHTRGVTQGWGPDGNVVPLRAPLDSFDDPGAIVAARVAAERAREAVAALREAREEALRVVLPLLEGVGGSEKRLALLLQVPVEHLRKLREPMPTAD